jgi:lipase chaperone LimK
VSRRRLVAASVAAGVLAVAGVGWFWGGDRSDAGPGHGAGSAGALDRTTGPAAVSPVDSPDPPPAADDAPWPRALRGTTPSGALRVDAHGHFVPGPETILFFEYFLSASNEESLGRLTERIRDAIRARLGPPADGEAQAFLARYLEYLEAGAAEFRAPGLAESADLERRLQWIRELRREHFGPELARRLFGAGEDMLRVHLERRRIRDEPGLTVDERRERLAALEARYPPRVREARARALAPLLHAQAERALRDAGASEAEVDALRTEHFGAEAAARLRALDGERARWRARWEAYLEARRALAADLHDPVALAEATASLRAEHFEGDEIRRVEILERAEASPSRMR